MGINETLEFCPDVVVSLRALVVDEVWFGDQLIRVHFTDIICLRIGREYAARGYIHGDPSRRTVGEPLFWEVIGVSGATAPSPKDAGIDLGQWAAAGVLRQQRGDEDVSHCLYMGVNQRRSVVFARNGRKRGRHGLWHLLEVSLNAGRQQRAHLVHCWRQLGDSERRAAQPAHRRSWGSRGILLAQPWAAMHRWLGQIVRQVVLARKLPLA